MFYGDRNYVMQFKDGTFLKRGVFHGFVAIGDNFGIGKTTELKEANSFSMEWQAERIAYDLGITEPYEVKEVEIIIKLKG